MKRTKNFFIAFTNAMVILGVFTLALFSFGIPAAHAAIPTFVACGTASENTTAITPALPAGIAANDILLLFLETGAQAITVANGNGGTWAEVTNSPQNSGATTRLTVFWSRYNGTQGNPTTSDSGDHQIGAICAYRGVESAGDPWDVTSGDIDTTTDTSGSIPGATTTGPDRLIVIVGGGDDDADTPITTVTNADLANISAARINAETASGNDGGLTVFDGAKSSAGAYGATALTYTAATTKGMMTISLKPPVTTLGDGTDPSNSSIAPGASATDLDTFTLQTTSGSDTVTAATVTLAFGTSGGLSLVAITDNAGSTTYCSQANPVSDTVSLSSCAIPVSTTLTSFKIRITPKSHANMPAPPGSTYTVTGTVTSFTSTNSQSGTDTDSATVTIDNASPANVTSASGSAGDTQVSLSWTNPTDSDFHSTVVLRRAGTATSDTPTEGTTYTAGNTIGSSVVACVVASPTANCTDTGLTNSTAYHYRIYARDTNANYSQTGVVPTGSPFTPSPPADTTAPAAIANLAASNATNNSIDLSWTAPGDDNSTGTATTYDVRYSTSVITAGNFGSATQATGEPSPQIAGTNQSMTVSGLSASTLYYFAIKTSDEVPNTSAISNVVNLSTTAAPDTTAPAAVTNLATGSVTSSSIAISWTAPGDDNNTGTATTYDVRYSTATITDGNFSSATQVTGEPTPSIAGSNEAMTVGGLSANTTYFFALKTSDEVPNASALSNVPSTSTSAPVPSASAGTEGSTGGVQPRRVLFSGRAYPESTVEVLQKNVLEEFYTQTPSQAVTADADGIFSISFTGIIGTDYLFALRATDKEARQSGTLAFNISLLGDLFEAKDILIPPTVGLEKSQVAKNDVLEVRGFAAPDFAVELEVDGSRYRETEANHEGIWKISIDTAYLSLGEHRLRARQTAPDGKKSNFSPMRVFRLAQSRTSKADLNNDGVNNISDWSIFLFRWGNEQESTRIKNDLNGDGSINIFDFSIFLQAIRS